jgi:hypothetical protein
VNWGCGAQVADDQLEALFASLPPNSVVTTNAMQAMAFNNKTTHTIDFAGIDRVLNAAARHGQRVILGLASQNGDCSDGHWKDQAWYDGGYRLRFDDGRHLEPLSFWDYLHRIVPRYRSHPALAYWGLVGEPESSNCAAGYAGSGCYGHLICPPGAGNSLRKFFDVVGGELKRLDPKHLLAAGTIGGGQCGTAGADFELVNRSPAIDIVEVHEYGADDIALPASHQTAAALAVALSKPVLVGEVGLSAAPATAGCRSTESRSTALSAKISSHFAVGFQGYVFWQWAPEPAPGCTYEIGPRDPAMRLVRGT